MLMLLTLTNITSMADSAPRLVNFWNVKWLMKKPKEDKFYFSKSKSLPKKYHIKLHVA